MWFRAQFDLHRQQKHPPEDQNRAAVLIVKEAASIHIQK
jgi:hypothetical protein